MRYPSSKSTLSLIALLALTLGAGCASSQEETDGEATEDAVTASRDEGRLVDIPFYFSVPKSAVRTELNRAGYSYPTVWNTSKEVKEAGLRVIAIKQAGTTPAAKKTARLDMAQQLARAGVLKDGDIALTFRPELADSMAYPHIQMGSTHASLVYMKNGQAFNVDSPLDEEYVGQFSTKHFIGGPNANPELPPDMGTDGLHILRPAGFDDGRRANLGKWATAVAKNRAFGKVRFQKDYLAPIFHTQNMTTKQTVTQLGKIILGEGTMDLPMYCSEFAWHMLALSACTDAEIRAAGPDGAACVAPVFEPMQLASIDSSTVGLAEGPLVTINAAPAEDRAALIKLVFPENPGPNAAKLSSGHRAVALKVQPLMPGLQQFFGGRAQGATPEMTASGATRLNAGVGSIPNYSPTAYLVSAMQRDGLRKMDYIATVVFVDSQADLDKAKRLSMPQGSSIPQ
jgi:hypothetical protein